MKRELMNENTAGYCTAFGRFSVIHGMYRLAGYVISDGGDWRVAAVEARVLTYSRLPPLKSAKRRCFVYDALPPILMSVIPKFCLHS